MPVWLTLLSCVGATGCGGSGSDATSGSVGPDSTELMEPTTTAATTTTSTTEERHGAASAPLRPPPCPPSDNCEQALGGDPLRRARRSRRRRRRPLRAAQPREHHGLGVSVIDVCVDLRPSPLLPRPGDQLAVHPAPSTRAATGSGRSRPTRSGSAGLADEPVAPVVRCAASRGLCCRAFAYETGVTRVRWSARPPRTQQEERELQRRLPGCLQSRSGCLIAIALTERSSPTPMAASPRRRRRRKLKVSGSGQSASFSKGIKVKVSVKSKKKVKTKL